MTRFVGCLQLPAKVQVFVGVDVVVVDDTGHRGHGPADGAGPAVPAPEESSA